LLPRKIISAAHFCCQKSNFAAQKNKNVAAQKKNFAAQSNKFAAHFTNSLCKKGHKILKYKKCAKFPPSQITNNSITLNVT
jgi:hypothetical protein